ncbi:MAG TPA: hypothetical protein VMW31_04775 [Devosiaceae bacterium]|nr:hypothetical protein [Devosiaceae bacterium]
MIGFQPYETFQLLIESGGIERAGTLLTAACDAFARRPRPTQGELAQFEALTQRLFATAAPSACEQAAGMLATSAHLTPLLERLVVANIGGGIDVFIAEAPAISPSVQIELAADGHAPTCALLARRSDLTRDALARLFAINSRAVYRALAGNQALTFSGPWLAAIARAARMDPEVARALLAKPRFDRAQLAPAFFNLAEPGRLDVLRAFGARRVPETALKRTYEQLSVATPEFCQALMKLYSANRRPEITRLFNQITGLDEVRCGEIAHDSGGAALFVILRAFGCKAPDGLKVLVHATIHAPGRTRSLGDYARLFELLSADAMVYLMSIWRGEADLRDFARPEYQPVAAGPARAPAAGQSDLGRAMAVMQRIVGAA